MSARRHLPWIDFILYGGLALLSIVLTLIFVWNTELGGVLALLATTTGFVVVAFVVIIRWYVSEPDYTEDTYGVSVWTDGIWQLGSTAGRINLKKALDVFVKKLPSLITKLLPETAPEQMVTSGDLSAMLYSSRLEFRDKKLGTAGIGWSVKDAAGLQQGRGIMLRWQGSLVRSALFHELFHMVDEMILRMAPDYKHERNEWWALVGTLKDEATAAGVV